ncbi:MAG: hypothetical protein ACI9XU_002105 [Arenicella sp.]|jgi:hypothetical protein
MRRKIMLLHLIIASLITPMVLLVSISGGLYLSGYKGAVTSVDVDLPVGAQLDFKSKDLLETKDLEANVRRLIKSAGIEHDFEYLKVSNSAIQTRPTSRVYLEFQQRDSLTLTVQTPNLQKTLIELHKGHGPTLFKLYQKFCAVGLISILLSGVYMGLASPSLRSKTLISLLLGLGLFVVVGFL